jgi:hypothetical protein
MNMIFKNLVLFVIACCFTIMANGQQQAFKLIYQRVNNGQVDTTDNYSFIFYNNVAYLSSGNSTNKEFIDFNRKELVDILQLGDDTYRTVTPFSKMDTAELKDEKETILGYECSKAVYKAFSNTIEVWYTTEAAAKGSPYKSYMPENSLVLKIVINGNRALDATEIKQLEEELQLSYPYENSIETSKAEARELQIKSRYTNVPVFNKQIINFGDEITNPEFGLLDTTYRFSKGTVILKKIKLPETNKKGAMVYATITNWSNGDAYDRTCSLFTIAGKKDKSVLDALQDGIETMPVIQDKNGDAYQGFVSTPGYEAPVELMRFFTSFGVSHFNTLREINNYKWQDSVVYKQEITSLIPNTTDEIWIGVFIGNYDKGGHKLSLDLQFYPAWDDGAVDEKWIEPLFNTVNILEMSGQNYGRLFDTDTLEMEFTLPENIDELQLLYTTTGHGGWGGGDEFNPKLNQVFIDDSLIFSQVPWRTDCATYRMSNPASGNFENGLSSSDLSRSNWCPATLTPPFFIPLKYLKPGKHNIQVVIGQGEDEGSAFSHWAVSGVLIGNISANEQ